jgi:glutamate/tyrosine decarboxylase-like PLP-dependent enzyme
MAKKEELQNRESPLDLNPDEFRRVGHTLVDRLADFLDTLPSRPVTLGETPKTIRQLLGNHPLPDSGMNPDKLMEETADLLFDHSLFNGHPRFWGYITSSAAPIGSFGDFLAGVINQNVGAWSLSPTASEIEAQTIRWIAEMIGFPKGSGGILVSGGNTANFVAFLAARRAKANWDIQTLGMKHPKAVQLRVYASTETHTWIQKAADQYGMGTDAIRWIPTDEQLRIDLKALEEQILADKKMGELPFLVVGSAGTVSTGTVDPLPEIAKVCKQHTTSGFT